MVHAGGVSMQRWLGGAAGLAEAGSARMAVLDRNWHCRWGELDLVLERQQQLLVIVVKRRRTGCRDLHGLDVFYPAKLRRMARAISCWRTVHPASAEQLLRVKLAIVPLMTSRRTIR